MCHIEVVLHKIGRLYVLPASRGISSLKARLEGNTPRRAISKLRERKKPNRKFLFLFALFSLFNQKGKKLNWSLSDTIVCINCVLIWFSLLAKPNISFNPFYLVLKKIRIDSKFDSRFMKVIKGRKLRLAIVTTYKCGAPRLHTLY